MSGIESWSTTPANNNQAPPFGWPAGILPSQVEPIGRQMMTSLAAWYQAAEWINYNFTPVYVSATQFTISGNVTSTFHVGRRLQATDGATSVYGTITVSAFTSLTTVTVVWDSGVLQTGVTIVYVGLTSKVNTSAPVQALTAAAFANPSATIGLAAVNGTATTAMSSDSAPPLSQAISPTWSGTHAFSNAITVNGAGTSIKGGVTIAAPSAGTALAVNAATSGSESVRIIGDATFYSSYNSANSIRTGYLQFTTTAGVNLVSEIAQPINFLTSAVARMVIAAGGAVTINAPSSGNALSVTGIANQNTQQINGSSTSGQSFGLRIDAGTNSSDRALYVGNQASSVQYFGVRGDGLVQAVDQGGALQDVGWRGTPIRAPAGSDTPTVADRGKTVQAANGAVITMPSGVFSAGDVVTVAIANGATCTVAQGTSLSLVWAGNGSTTGNRTLTGAGLCTILYLSASFALISGAGLT